MEATKTRSTQLSSTVLYNDTALFKYNYYCTTEPLFKDTLKIKIKLLGVVFFSVHLHEMWKFQKKLGLKEGMVFVGGGKVIYMEMWRERFHSK